MTILKKDLLWLSDAVRDAYSCTTAAELVKTASDHTDSRWDLVTNAVEEFNLNATVYIAHGLRNRGGVPKEIAACLHDHPLLSLIQAGKQDPVMHLNQLVRREQWERTDHYAGVAQVVGFQDEIVLFAQSASTYVVFSLFTESPLGATDRLLAQLLQPHLQAAWRRVTASRGELETLDLPKVQLSADYQPLELSESQRAIFKQYFPHWHPSRHLPTSLGNWVRAWIERWTNDPLAAGLTTFAAHSERGRLIVRCFPDRLGQSPTLHLIEVPHSSIAGDGHVLTTREQTVLYWVKRGKRDADIAQILGISRSTVSKHVEHILAKLHVGSRTAAAIA